MLHTTFRKAREFHACQTSYHKMAKALGGIRKYGSYTKTPLTKILEVCGLQDALWCLRCTIEPSKGFSIELACRYAEHTLHFFEDRYPDDKRPRQAIDAARNCITDKSNAVSAARAAARAARAAASAVWATASAARAAANAAWAAASAAWAATSAARDTRDAAASAASAASAARAGAAGAAARDAEIEWQTKIFIEMLNK